MPPEGVQGACATASIPRLDAGLFRTYQRPIDGSP